MTRFRHLRWAAASAVTAVMAAGAVGPMAASAGGRPAWRGCYRPGTTIVQDKAGRFFRLGSAWYVCAFKQDKPRKLPYGGECCAAPWDSSAKASGRYVAFFVFSPTGSAALNGVTVIDMVTGRPTFSEGDILARFWPDHLVLKADGSVAWTAPMPPPQTPVIWEVRRHDSTGTVTVASGSHIDPYSLAAGGSWLYWTDAGSPRSAPFH